MGPCGGRCGCGWMGKGWFFSCAVGTGGSRGPPGRGALVGFSLRRWNGGESWLTQPGPHFLGRNGEKNSRGKRFFPLDSLLWWDWVGEAVLLMEYLACGPLSERPVTARPPAGRAGDVDRYPLGKGGEKPFRFPLVPPVNEPLLPPAQAGGRAMRRWSWRPQARPLPDGTTFPVPPTREWGSKGKEPPSPWCSFPYFFQEIGPRPEGQVPARFNGTGENPHWRGTPLPHSRKEVTTGSVTAQRMVLRKFTREAKVSSTP